MKTLIIIPTYNEADNIEGLLKEIFELNLDLSVLVVDDNSPDNTAQKVIDCQNHYADLFLLKRQAKDGLGRAYLAGFTWAKNNGYESVIQMDADFSHSPKHLSSILQTLADNDFVVGSRYVKGGSVVNWPLRRKLISLGGSLYARIILGLKIKDLTGGFNAWRKSVWEKFDESTIKANGYSFQIELKNQAVRAGHSWTEVPITFEERRNGQSKLRGKIIWEAVWRVWQIRLKNWHWPTISLLLATLLLATIVYWPGLHGTFLNWDDAMQVTKNPDIQALFLSNLKRMFSSFYVGMYQPMTSLTYAIEYKLFGLKSFNFHLFSLLIHLANVLLAFKLIKTLKQPTWLALTVASLMAVHPMNVEAVAWISATSTLLFSFWLLLATIFYLKYLEQNQRHYFWLSFGAFLISTLSKSAAIIFPFIMLGADYLKGHGSLKKNWPRIIFVFLISCIFGYLTLFGRQDTEHILNLGEFYNPLQRIIMVLYALFFYVAKFFAPLNLSPYYIYPQNPAQLPWIFYIYSLIVVVTLLVCFYLFIKKKLPKIITFSLLWFTVNLILVLKIVPLGSQITADRYNYLPAIGLILIAGYLAQKFWQKYPWLKKIFLIILLGTILFFAYLSRRQTAVWRDNVIFFNTAISQAPNEAGLYDLRGISKREIGDSVGALADANQAVAINPTDDLIRNDRALILAEDFGRYDEALSDLNFAIAIRPRFHLFYYNRGDIKVLKRDLNGAIDDFSQAIELEPHSKYFFNRGNCYFELNKYQEAIDNYNQAVNLNANFSLAFFNKSLALQALDKMTEACDSATQAANLNLVMAQNWYKENCLNNLQD